MSDRDELTREIHREVCEGIGGGSDCWDIASVILTSDWLADRDRKMKAEGVREAAESWPTLTRDMVSRGQVRAWLTTRAERAEAGE